MISHLIIKANGKDLALPDNFSIDIEDANPLFNDNEMYTFPVSIPMDGNRHLVKNMEAINSDVRAVDVEHTKMQIIVDGIPYRSGVAVVDDAQDLDGNFDFSIQSMRESLEDKISDLECCDIPVKDKIQIGEMIGDVEVEMKYKALVYLSFYQEDVGEMSVPITPHGDIGGDYSDKVKVHVPLQALGFSYPYIVNEIPGSSGHEAERIEKFPHVIKTFINVSEGYPGKAYCNTRVCYKHYKPSDKDSGESEQDLSGEYSPYYVLEARRPQSGINFYVLYFLDCLFDYLGISYDNTNLQKVEDLKRMFFFNTKCEYDVERKYSGKKDFNGLADINRWVASRAENMSNCGKLEFEVKGGKTIKSITLEVAGKNYTIVKDHRTRIPSGKAGVPDVMVSLETGKVRIADVKYDISANIMKMYANAKNFPSENVTSIIDSLWNAFGIRFMYNYEDNKVRPILIREVYRDASAPILLPCKVISCQKVAEKKTGFRMRFSVESDKKEQKSNIKYGVRDYDSNFDYIDYQKVDKTLSYENIIQKRSSTDMTTYLDMATGNAYRLKVDKDAESVTELNARIFEVGGYKGVEIGDCGYINEDFIEDYVIGFSPMLFTDVNILNEISVGTSKKFSGECSALGGNVTIAGVNNASRDQIFAAYLDENMKHENELFQIENAVGSDFADAVLRENITTDESYDPESTEDGNSPLQHADWGCAVGFMRGGGSDATLQCYDYNYDGFGNSKWRIVSGSYDSTSDCIDNWGNHYDYNANMEGIGDGERISLKIRSWKPDPEDGSPMCVNDPKIKNRGLFDTFMSEHAHFLLNRKKYKIVCECEIAALADIPNHWERRYQIGNVVGWINQISSSVSVKDGLGLVEIEMYSL